MFLAPSMPYSTTSGSGVSPWLLTSTSSWTKACVFLPGPFSPRASFGPVYFPECRHKHASILFFHLRKLPRRVDRLQWARPPPPFVALGRPQFFTMVHNSVMNIPVLTLFHMPGYFPRVGRLWTSLNILVFSERTRSPSGPVNGDRDNSAHRTGGSEGAGKACVSCVLFLTAQDSPWESLVSSAGKCEATFLIIVNLQQKQSRAAGVLQPVSSGTRLPRGPPRVLSNPCPSMPSPSLECGTTEYHVGSSHLGTQCTFDKHWLPSLSS